RAHGRAQVRRVAVRGRSGHPRPHRGHGRRRGHHRQRRRRADAERRHPRGAASASRRSAAGVIAHERPARGRPPHRGPRCVFIERSAVENDTVDIFAHAPRAPSMRRPAMTRTPLLSLGLAAALLAVLPATRAEANFRSYVSTTGSGTACTLTAPCPDLGSAIAATESDGEVHCLDAGSSNSISGIFIQKSMTIDCPISVWGVVVNGAGITATLRNVTVNSFGASPGSL